MNETFSTTGGPPDIFLERDIFYIAIPILPIYLIMLSYLIYRVVTIIILENRFTSLKLISNYFLLLSIFFKYRAAILNYSIIDFFNFHPEVLQNDPVRGRFTFDFLNTYLGLVFLLSSYSLLLIFWVGLYHDVFITRHKLFVGISKHIFIIHTSFFLVVGILAALSYALRTQSKTIYQWGYVMFVFFLVVVFGTSILLTIGFVTYGVLIWKRTKEISRSKPNNRILGISLFLASIIFVFFAIFFTLSMGQIGRSKLLRVERTWIIDVLDYYIFIIICVGIMVLLLRKPIDNISNNNNNNSNNNNGFEQKLQWGLWNDNHPTCTSIESETISDFDNGSIKLKPINHHPHDHQQQQKQVISELIDDNNLPPHNLNHQSSSSSSSLSI